MLEEEETWCNPVRVRRKEGHEEGKKGERSEHTGKLMAGTRVGDFIRDRETRGKEGCKERLSAHS